MKKLFFKEKMFKITDHYPILDEDGRAAYYLDQDFKLVGYRSKVSDKDGKEIFNVDRKIISLLPRYTINIADGSQMVIQQKLAFFTKKIDVYMENETLNLQGEVFSYNFEIYNGKREHIGSVNRRFFALTDTYELAIYNDFYEEELIALVICLNNMIDMDRAAASSGS